MKSTRAYNKRLRLNEAAENGVAAIINISPNSVIDLMEGDELTVDMITDADDEPLEQLISLADAVIVDEVLGDNSYKVAVNVSDELSGTSLYHWICTYTNITSLDEIEEKVAPGLSSLLDDVDDEADSDIDAAPADDDDYIPFPEDDDDIEDTVEDDDMIGESVTSKFAKYRKVFEAASEVLNEKGEEEEEGADDSFDDIFGDAEGEEPAKEEGDEAEADAEGEEGDADADEEDTEDVPMTAVLLTVNKDDADKCKDEMIEAGIAEDDIEILEEEDDEDTVKIKVDVNSVHELKDYLAGKGIDLEEKIGGEIVDDEEDEEKEGSESEEDEEKKDGEGDEEDPFADMDFGDIFGDDEEGAEGE
jgi:hypothetical protein